jgi:putative transposase
MSRYRRVKIQGGWFFFTVTLADRSTDLLVRHVDRLRKAYAAARRRDSFETIAICVLPDHLHAIWALPEDDADFSRRWSLIKHDFSRGLPGNPDRGCSKLASGRKEFGSDGFGNTLSAMRRISRATLTTFISIR